MSEEENKNKLECNDEECFIPTTSIESNSYLTKNFNEPPIDNIVSNPLKNNTSDLNEEIKNSYYLTEKESEDLSGLIYDEIQITLKKEEDIAKVFEYFLGIENRTKGIIESFMHNLRIGINSHSLTQAINCLIVIVHVSLKSYDYKKLVNDIKVFKNISRNSAKKHVLRNIKALEKSKNFNLNNWLPDKRHKPTKEEIDYWIILLKKLGSLNEIRRELEKEKKYVPEASTLSKYLIKSIEHEEYQNYLKKKVNWVERTPYNDLQELAKKIGKEKTEFVGKLKTPEDLYNKIPYPDGAFLDWLCGRCDDIFKQTPHQVKKGSWCEKCVKEIQRIKMINPIETVREAARKVGLEKTGYEGTFMADAEQYYKKRETPPIHTYFWWLCGKCGFKWPTTPDKVINRRQWCPYCSQGFYERICRGCIEHIYSHLMKREIRFPQTSLDQVVISSSGINALKKYNPKLVGFNISDMHLDGFNPLVNTGFERNGKQHYERVIEWHPNEGDFEKQIKLDDFRVKLCNDNIVFLITVGWEMQNGEWKRIEPEEMQDYIIKQIEERYKIILPEIPKFDYKEFIRNNLSKNDESNKQSTKDNKFRYLTEIQKRVLSEFQNNDLFFSDLDKMPHLNDLKYINSTIRDLYEKEYLTRIHTINPNATGNREKQYKYSITKKGLKVLELSS
ncbi:MAG: zinc-ribbon domain-containing protein [Promethearchaeota archaeon]